MQHPFPSIAFSIILAGVLFACGDGEHKAPDHAGSHEQWYELQFDLNDSVRASAYANGTQDSLVIQNNGEEIALERLTNGNYRIPVFDGAIAGEWSENNTFTGEWLDKMTDPFGRIPLTIRRIPNPPSFAEHNFTSEPKKPYALTIAAEGDAAWFGQLILQTNKSAALATIKTDTGDLRYLGGEKDDENIVLTTFDGAHLYRIDVSLGDDSLHGTFHAHSGYTAAITGHPLAHLPPSDPMRIKATGPLDFTVVVDQDSTVERWTADRFQGSVTIIDLMGTWCPNCMDATRLLKELKTEFPSLQIASVAFERKSNPRATFERFQRFQRDMGVNWLIVYGGPARKKETAYKMDFLTGFESFPTTLILDKQGNIAYVHTGFNGPATGSAYEQERKFFRAAVRSLQP